jgi:hypothetical protein
MTTPGGAGTTHPPVLGTPASIMGRSSHGGYVRGLRPFASPHPDAARLGCPDLRTMGDATRGSPIPLHGGIKAHALCEENAHLRHMQRLIRALQRVTILLLSRACLYPPLQGGPAFLLPPPRPEALERVMNSIRNALGMRETEIAREPRRPWNPHFYAVFAQVHNTL